MYITRVVLNMYISKTHTILLIYIYVYIYLLLCNASMAGRAIAACGLALGSATSPCLLEPDEKNKAIGFVCWDYHPR